MNSEQIREGVEVINELRNDSGGEITPEIMERYSMHSLRMAMVQFFTDVMSRQQENSKLKQKVQEKIEEFLDTRDLGLEELISLYSMISEQELKSTRDIIQVVRPESIQGSNTGMDSNGEPIKDVTSQYTSEQLQKIDKIYKWMSRHMKKGSE